MSTGVFMHPWLGGLFADDAMAAIWSPETQLGHMRAFEAAWSRTLGAIGRVPRDVAEDVARRIETAEIDADALRSGAAEDGLPIPALVASLKAAAGEEGVHIGATSQDVIDTGLALTLRATRQLLEARLIALEAKIVRLTMAHGDVPLMGRTRMQAATIMTVKDRLLAWRKPIADHLERLESIAPRVEVVQVGGAAGDRAAMGGHADAIVAQMAKAFDLFPSEKAWHTTRDGVAEFASVLSLITGHLGKIGQDICLMAQQGIDEITMEGGGSSSAMPHKQNPILAELMVTLARYNAVQVSGMHQALIHEQERSGAAWTLEWMVLPQMALATGRSVTAAVDLMGRITKMGTPGPI